MMFILAGLLLIGYGYSHIYYKDFWWWDAVLLWERLNRPAHRTERWEFQQDLFGLLCMAGGVCLLLYFAAGGAA